MTDNEYKCSMCEAVFKKGVSDEQAVSEHSELFPEHDITDSVLVCDDCFKAFQEWSKQEFGGSYSEAAQVEQAAMAVFTGHGHGKAEQIRAHVRQMTEADGDALAKLSTDKGSVDAVTTRPDEVVSLGDPDSEETPLWPEKWTAEQLEDTRRRLKDFEWRQEYMLEYVQAPTRDVIAHNNDGTAACVEKEEEAGEPFEVWPGEWTQKQIEEVRRTGLLGPKLVYRITKQPTCDVVIRNADGMVARVVRDVGNGIVLLKDGQTAECVPICGFAEYLEECRQQFGRASLLSAHLLRGTAPGGMGERCG